MTDKANYRMRTVTEQELREHLPRMYRDFCRRAESILPDGDYVFCDYSLDKVNGRIKAVRELEVEGLTYKIHDCITRPEIFKYLFYGDILSIYEMIVAGHKELDKIEKDQKVIKDEVSLMIDLFKIGYKP